jgi:hypothetical protein
LEAVMTARDTDATIGAPEDLPPVSSEEAAEIVRNDDALNAATADSSEDAATDEDARG